MPARGCKKRAIAEEPSDAAILLPPSRPIESLQQGLRDLVTAENLTADDAALAIGCLLHAPGRRYVARRIDDALLAHGTDGGTAMETLLGDLKQATSLSECLLALAGSKQS
jgi:hypothetical protein